MSEEPCRLLEVLSSSIRHRTNILAVRQVAVRGCKIYDAAELLGEGSFKMTARTIDIHNHGYSKKFIDCCRRGEGERYGIRLAADAKGEALLRPDGVCFRLQPKRTD